MQRSSMHTVRERKCKDRASRNTSRNSDIQVSKIKWHRFHLIVGDKIHFQRIK